MAHPGGYPAYPGAAPAAGTGYPGQAPAAGYPGGAPPVHGGYPPSAPPMAAGYPPTQPAQGYGPGAAPGGIPAGIDPSVYQWFLTVDQDKSGRINMYELQQALTNANWTHFNAETCRLMIGMFDRDQSGQIDSNEFGALWQYITQWRGVFEQFDSDRSGAIDANELLNAYTHMGYRLSPQYAQMVIYRYDPLNKQKLTLDNFIQSCVMLKTVSDSFKQKDTQMQGRIQVGYEEFLMMVLLNKPV